MKKEVLLRRGVRQGDSISPKLFTAALEYIFRKIDWKDNGLNINGRKLTHLRFADDIILISHNTEELQEMLDQMNYHCSQYGLKINTKKTKVIVNTSATTNTPITLDSSQLESVEEYIYLGQTIRADKNMDNEISRRIRNSWIAFSKYKEVLNGPSPLWIKREIFNSVILPTMTYGCETWAVTKKQTKRLEVAQRAMERRFLNITIMDKRRNTY